MRSCFIGDIPTGTTLEKICKIRLDAPNHFLKLETVSWYTIPAWTDDSGRCRAAKLFADRAAISLASAAEFLCTFCIGAVILPILKGR